MRHNIFEYAATRDTKPKKLLRYWFEKQEVKELVAKTVADNPTGPAPQVVQGNEYEEDSDAPEPAAEEEGEEDSDNEDGDEADQDGEENENEGDEDAEAEFEEDQDTEVEAETEEVADDQEDAMEDAVAQDVAQPSKTADAQPLPTPTNVAAQTLSLDDIPDDLVEADMDIDESANAGAGATAPQSGETAAEDAQDVVDEDGDTDMAGQEGDNGEDNDEDGEDTTATDGTAAVAAQPPPPPQAPIICASRKWRHIPNFMRLTHCPPPTELLLTSQQLHDEAENWFYDVAILRISATNSFAHTSFFEEAFEQITDAAFSPMENIRKVEVMFVWDTTWLRADENGFAAAVFPALLRKRAEFVHDILKKAPDLREVVIHYHDSAQDDESMGFMVDILSPFHGLNAQVKIEEHYIAVDAKPRKSSVAGRQRVQFQQIVDAGIERLF